MIYAVINQKGGVGKTTETINLARVASNNLRRTLVIDADAQGNLSGILASDDVDADQLTFADVLVGEEIADVQVNGIWPSISVVPGNQNTTKATKQLHSEHGREYRLREALEKVRDVYDLILIDCAPSLDLHTVNALTAADRAIVMTQPGKFSLDGLSQLQESFDSVQKYYNPLLTVAGIVVNGVRNTVGHRSWISELEGSTPWPMIQPYIPMWSLIQDAAEAAYGLDQWTVDAARARDAYELYARHYSALEKLDLRQHMESVFPKYDFASKKGF
uniref:Putative chromosome partitioning ATPase n=1 Tax=Arthrobacter sp. J3.40 TaxID=347209 RepID=I3W105_9MICC|nr:ParA family protein [Arthrobacter sp. J3.40]AFK89282.1 putative chromosome partitioning ATPase [Arthrobacter sp. J3.40]